MEPNEIEGLAPNSDQQGQRNEALWQDLASVHKLADEAMGNPQVRRLAMALRCLCQVVEHLAGEVEALKSAKPCEGCGGDAQMDSLVAALMGAIEQGRMPELVATVLEQNKVEEKERGILGRALEAVGLKVGG